jgi:hypothetical protein
MGFFLSFADHCTPPAVGGVETPKATSAAVMVAAVAAAAAVTSPSPAAAAAAAGGDQTTQLLLPSIHKIMEEDKLKELNGGKTPPLADTPPALDVADMGVAATAAAKKLGPLVDYDSDSDEESSTSEEESSSTSSALPPAKRLKTASGGAPAV